MIELQEEKTKNKFEIKNMLKNLNDTVTGDVLANLAYSSMIMIYFMFFNIQYEVLPENFLIKYINISSLIFLGISILMIELSYKKEKDSILLYGVEFLLLAIFTLLIKHIPKLLSCNVQTYILIGSYLFALYYMLKSTVLYTKERQEELKSFIDIKEIVKEEPIKRITKRKNIKKEEGK